MAEININKLFENAFGYTQPAPAEIAEAVAQPVYSSLGQPYKATDAYGYEHFLPVTLSGAFNNGGTLEPFSYIVPFAVVGIDTQKTVISTAMPERGGSVKEVISLDDYVISIKGIVISKDNSFPEAQIKEMQNVFLVNQSITLRSALTDIFLNGIFEHRVVIKSVKWPPAAGVEHARAFEMICESDMIFTLEL